MAVLAVALGTQGEPARAAAGQSAPAAALAETDPVDTPGVDPVLDAVPVEETAQTRSANDALDRAGASQADAQRRWISSEQNRAGLITRAATADQRVADATQALSDRGAEQAAAEDELQKMETELRDTLASAKARGDKTGDIAGTAVPEA